MAPSGLANPWALSHRARDPLLALGQGAEASSPSRGEAGAVSALARVRADCARGAGEDDGLHRGSAGAGGVESDHGLRRPFPCETPVLRTDPPTISDRPLPEGQSDRSRRTPPASSRGAGPGGASEAARGPRPVQQLPANAPGPSLLARGVGAPAEEVRPMRRCRVWPSRGGDREWESRAALVGRSWRGGGRDASAARGGSGRRVRRRRRRRPWR